MSINYGVNTMTAPVMYKLNILKVYLGQIKSKSSLDL